MWHHAEVMSIHYNLSHYKISAKEEFTDLTFKAFTVFIAVPHNIFMWAILYEIKIHVSNESDQTSRSSG
jgi:hypothetical protein